jgi:hypothetical protein
LGEPQETLEEEKEEAFDQENPFAAEAAERSAIESS